MQTTAAWRIPASRRAWLISLVLAGPGAFAAEPDCWYGEGKYTVGTILCQAGMTMQCRRDDEGRPVWASLEQQCAVPAQENALSGTETTAPAGRPESPESRVADRAPAGPAATSIGPGQAGGAAIEILWADYGRDGHKCDAAPAVTERCDGQAECELVVSGDALCGDPYPKRTKLLSIYFACTDATGSYLQPPVYAEDDSHVALHCTNFSKRQPMSENFSPGGPSKK
ncbi:MAG TPA: hypothetical protein VKZ85_04400 [Woeseiaceae bacterium]|nr:hypothetical protein [Woeseiaceae bacterium]